MSNWLVTGGGGMLATDLTAELRSAGVAVTAPTRSQLDITSAAEVDDAIATLRPDVVVNTAAYTRVDDAETHEDDAYRVNGTGPALLASACARAGHHPVLLQLSTDYVFDGAAGTPYPEAAPTAPRTAYGRTKLAGERAVVELLPGTAYVVRTAWLYGAHGRSFVGTMVRLVDAAGTVDVVDDQHGQPTSTVDLAVRLRELGELALADRAAPGVYHGVAGGSTTWYGLARQVFTLLGADPDRVRPTTSVVTARPAPRPAWSVLAQQRWHEVGLQEMREWPAALADALPAVAAAVRGGPSPSAPTG